MSLENNNSSSIKYVIKNTENEYLNNCASKNTKYKKKFSEKLNPKLKLPPIIKAKSNATFRHEIWKTNVQYHEMKEELTLLKKVLFDEQKCEQLNINNENMKNDDTKLDLSIASSLENIIDLENKLEVSSLELEEIKTVRLKEQNEICKVIQSLNTCPFEQRSSQSFHKLCNYKTKDNTNKKNLIPINKPKYLIKRRKGIKNNHQKSHDKSKNKQLSINLSMSALALTDEEKARIQMLLADITDDDQDNTFPSKNLETCYEKNDDNAFLFNAEEKTKLCKIHDELMKYDETSEKRDFIKLRDDKKYVQNNWKEMKDLSIKEIDKALDAIHEVENTENTDKPTENSTDKEPDNLQ